MAAVGLVAGREVAKYCKSYMKINPNGVDLAPKEVTKLPTNLTIFLRGEERGYLSPNSEDVIQGKERFLPNKKGFYFFEQGGLYELRFPEVRIPASCTGFAFPRSSINRLGIIKLETAVFDSGYTGEPTQTIYTPLNAMIHKKEAMIQLVLIRNEKHARKLYSGYYQNERSTS